MLTVMSAHPPRLIIGITGATGVRYGARILELLRDTGIETHLIVSRAGDMTRAYESDLTAAELRALADHVYPIGHVGAAVASGSFPTLGMVIAPCSARTLSEIAYGNSSNLLTRAADVCLKERRRLVLLLRETPLSLVHARAITAATEAGAIVAPPVPALYLRPDSIEEMIDHTVARALDLFGIDLGFPPGPTPNPPTPITTRTEPRDDAGPHIPRLAHQLRAIGDLQEVDGEVDWNLEMGAIIRRSLDLRAPAPLFNRVTGIEDGFRALGAPPSPSYRSLPSPTAPGRSSPSPPPASPSRRTTPAGDCPTPQKCSTSSAPRPSP
jgi:4-hydroxy-3-polyprenylbenzoate decarboxylase